MRGGGRLPAAMAALAFALFATPGFASEQVDRPIEAEGAESPPGIDALLRQLQEHGAAHGVTIESIGISKGIRTGVEDAPQAGAGSTTCTASAETEIPGGTRAKVTATTETCVSAVQMLEVALVPAAR